MPRNPSGELVEREFLTLPVWDRLDAHTAETVARTVERCLPEPWKFHRVEWHECGDQQRHVAFFKWKKAKFALVPGGKVTQGYDPKKPFEPTAEQQESWAHSRREYRFPALEQYLAKNLSPLRRALVSPALVEARATEWFPVEDEEELEYGKQMASINARLAHGGFRLPTADEWEHFCAAGSRTLWRWGNVPSFDKKTLQRPNAFGLVIAHDSYNPEWVEGPTSLRGGDGGSALCGGHGQLAAALILATAHRLPKSMEKELRDCGEPFYRRRVFTLPDSMLG